MARNGSGVMQRLYSWVTDAANGLKISSSRMDADSNDIANEITNSIAADGQTVPTANLPMGAFKHTNVGAATARTDYARTSQVQDSTFTSLGTVAGTNTITAAATPTLTAYLAGQRFAIIPANTVTAAATLNVDSVGALTIKKSIGGSLVANVVNDIVAGVPAYFILPDASTAVLINPQVYSHGADVASASTINLTTATGDIVDVTGTTTITAITLTEGVQRVIRFTGALTFTNGASLVIPGGTRTTSAGDFAIVRGYASGVVRVLSFLPADGSPVNRATGRSVTTSGTTVDLTGIASIAKRIIIGFEGVSTNGTSDLIIQLGSGVGPTYASASYIGACGRITSSPTSTAFTSGFIFNNAVAAAGTTSGTMTLVLSNPSGGNQTWAVSSACSDGTSPFAGGGSLNLGAAITAIRLTTAGGVNTFDAGAVSITVE